MGILAVTLIPGFWPIYPLLVLPLLLTGPLAVRNLPLKHALRAAALAGVLSGTLASLCLAVAWQVTGSWYWMLTSAASARPMPALPRVSILPPEWMTWPQQDILFLQPLMAVALGLLAVILGPFGQAMLETTGRWLPGSLRGRLRLAFGVLTVLTLGLGMIGFSMIEEMHMRTHRLQLQMDWQRELGNARAVLDQQLEMRVAGAELSDAAAQQEQVSQTYQRLSSTAPRTGISGNRDDIQSLLTRYKPLLDKAISTHEVYLATDADPIALTAAVTTLGKLQRAVETDVTEVLAGSDLSHHERLISVMGMVAVVAGLVLWTGERVIQTIGGPLAVLGAQVHRVARGDFSRRIFGRGPDELRRLGDSVNQMTADLARLYAVEREGRAMAESVARRERELSEAKEFWTNTLVHDLKNPLALIAGWSDLLQDSRHGSLDPSQTMAVTQIQQAAEALADLVADINDSFRLQAEALPLRREPVAPRDLLAPVADKYRGLGLPVPNVHVVGQPAPVLADVRLVSRVLHNLIGNAYKHAGESAQVVLVAETAGERVRFSVDDSGPGVPESERSRIFERFAQGRGSARGSGLGLAFCKLVVEQLGGRIWAAASPMGGARIAFELPLALAEAASPPREDASILSAPRVA